MTTAHLPYRLFVAFLLTSVLVALAPAAAGAALPDPMPRGPFAVTTMSVNDPANAGVPGDIGEAKVGIAALQEPNSTGGAIGTGTPNAAANSVNLQVRGSLYYPAARATPAPLILLVHGNHGSCHTGAGTGLGGSCANYNRNDAGYAYMAANLASWGYVVFSLDQDQLIFYQDGNFGKGMHQRRLLMAAALDGLYQANQPGGLPVDANDNLGTALVGKIDFSRIGLMGHSRGGDAVTSFLDYNRTRPLPGRRYNIRAVISLSPTDYERRAPYGVVYSTMVGACDGDVSNLMGTRMYERSLYIQPGDPFPRIQMVLHGANHDAFNTEWDVDGDDTTSADPACGPNFTTNPDSIRLGRGGNVVTAGNAMGTGYTRTNFFLDDPALMGDQARAGLAMMNEFFRRYVGGETPFDDYMTGAVSQDGVTPELPASACPTSASGTHMSCFQRLMTSYFAPPQERLNVIRPNPDQPLTVSELGTALTGGGFAAPYANSAGTVTPPATASGYDWCNPEPNQFTPSQLGITPTLPTAVKPCPLPAAAAIGGQNGTRENAPVNGAYGLQLTMAWDNPVTPAHLETRIPAANGNVSGYKVLDMGASVNYFDPRNAPHTGNALWNPEATTQNFTISLTDANGVTGTVQAADPRYGLALHETIGNISARVHIMLNQLRIPLTDFSAQGVDLHSLRNIQFKFGDTTIPGMPASGSIQLSDVRFQEAVSGPTVYADSPTANGAPAQPVLRHSVPGNPLVAEGLDPAPQADPSGPDGAAIIDDTPREPASVAIPDVVWLDGGASAGAAATAGCADKTAPAASIVSKKIVKGHLVLSGTASDKGCATSAVRSVQVVLYKHTAKGLCMFVKANGKTSKAVSCHTTFASLVASGTKKWSLRLSGKLAKGSYTAYVRAVDTAGNTQAIGKRIPLKVR